MPIQTDWQIFKEVYLNIEIHGKYRGTRLAGAFSSVSFLFQRECGIPCANRGRNWVCQEKTLGGWQSPDVEDFGGQALKNL